MPDFNADAPSNDAELHDDWPFEAWLKLAVGRYGLSPQEFWSISVKDWLTLTAPTERQALNREGFAALSARYPDIKDMNNHDPNR
ncbi:phage tail assembly chaperone [Fretibacter rubidus]|uniref:phage tail assembly chaperone n=1 Tax=Fretibacter rubidus TaxID=570162 RepID=UPI00352BB032